MTSGSHPSNVPGAAGIPPEKRVGFGAVVTGEPRVKTAPEAKTIDGAAFRIGVVAARFNEALVDGLMTRVVAALRAAGVKNENIVTARVPGSHEVPWAARALATGGQCDCVIGLGVL